MTPGAPQAYSETIALSPLTSQQFLVLAIQAAKKLEWELTYTGHNGFVGKTPFSTELQGTEIKVKIDEENATVTTRNTGKHAPEEDNNRQLTEAFITTLNELKEHFDPDTADERYRELEENFSDNGELAPQQTRMEKIKEFLSLFIPVKDYAATPVIIILNVVIFILMVLSGINFIAPDGESMVAWGANFGPATLNGQWWRLLTSCFLHFGIIHLLMNMYALLYIGVLLEPLLGTRRFAAAYLLTGIAASATSLWWHEGGMVSAGASGAVFGMYGVFLAMLTTSLVDGERRKALLTSIGIFVMYNLVYGLKGGIDNAAHIGGLLTGVVAGYLFYPAVKKPEDKTLNYIAMGALAAVVFAAGAFALTSGNNDMAKYLTALDRFTEYENEAIKAVNDRQNMKQGTDLLAEMDKSIENWKKGEAVLTEAAALDIDDEAKSRVQQLINYCQLRQKSFGLMRKGLAEGDEEKYGEEIANLEGQVSAIIDYLNKENSKKDK